MAWRGRQSDPQHKATADFQSAVGEGNLTKAMHFVTCKRPILQNRLMHTGRMKSATTGNAGGLAESERPKDAQPFGL